MNGTEQKDWNRIVAALRAAKKPSAPATLYGDVMTRIALERAKQQEASRRVYPGQAMRSDQFVHTIVSLFVMIGSWMAVVFTVPYLSDRLAFVFREALVTVQFVGIELLHGAGAVFVITSPREGGWIVAALWCGIGWAVTSLVRVLAQRSSAA